MTKKAEDLRNLSNEQLVEKMGSLRHELFTLKLNSLTTHLKDYSQFKKLRRDIARASTIIEQRIAAQVEG
jgi:large subunit ribosomal protein L29